MNELIKYFNKKYGKEYGKISYPRTTIQIYKVYQAIKSYGIKDEELVKLLHNVKLPKPKSIEEKELYTDCLYNKDDSEIEIDTNNLTTKEYVDTSLKNKVDKVTGKGLSTVDFTTAYETKLKKLENYNDTTIKKNINDINTQLGDIAKKIENVEQPTQEQMETAIDTYFGKHPITGGLTSNQLSALNEMFRVCAYIKNDISTEYNNFRTAFKINLKTYTITNNLTNCTSSNSITSVQEGSSYNATITANNNHILQAPTITMGGTDITSSVYSNGVISITNVTGNIVITCNAIEKTANTYTITNNLTECTNSNNNTNVVENSSYNATINTNDNYKISNIKVTMGGVDITTTAVSGNTITISKVTGNIEITALAIIITYTITNNLTNAKNSNSASSITKGSSYIATITANNNYILDTVTVTIGGTDVTSSVYNSGNINITNVTGNIVITVNAITNNVHKIVDIASATAEGQLINNTTNTSSYNTYMIDNIKTGDIIHTVANTSNNTVNTNYFSSVSSFTESNKKFSVSAKLTGQTTSTVDGVYVIELIAQADYDHVAVGCYTGRNDNWSDYCTLTRVSE